MAYNSAYTGSQVDAAVGAVRQKETIWDGKQDELTGTEDQLVGFNSSGEATAVSKPTAADVGAMPAVSGGTAGQVLTKTEAGQEWQDAPDGLPEGGTEGQVLTKTPTGAQWDDVPSDIPAGGTDGQILTKTADGVAWEDAPDTGVTSFNGRTGAVVPASGDYTADQVGARPSTWTPSASDVGAMPAVSGGSTGQVLTKTANGQAWQDAPEGGITQDAADARYLKLSGGTMDGPIQMGGSRITGVGEPQADTDAARKGDLPAISLASATLYSGSWTLSGGKYAQTVQISGVTASARLILPDPDTPGDDKQADEEVLQAWGAGPAKIAPSPGSGTITFYSWTQPTINIPIQVVVIT